jgi:hypothetical protein
MSALGQKQTWARSGHSLVVQALNYALACQHIHFVLGVAEERSEHFQCMLSKLRGSGDKSKIGAWRFFSMASTVQLSAPRIKNSRR